MVAAKVQDRRVNRTRQALRAAFIRLVNARRYEDIAIGDILAEADVGKSTFYEHYRSKDDLLAATFAGILVILAQADDTSHTERLDDVVGHLWENRRLGRSVFGPALGSQIRRMLADRIEQRRTATNATSRGNERIRALQIAAAHVHLLEAWTNGSLSASRGEIMRALQDIARFDA